jgi:MscS family membrane protein
MDNVLGMIIFHNTLGQWLVSLAWIVGGLGAGELCSGIAGAILRAIHGKTPTFLDKILMAVLGKPLGIVTALGGAAVGIRGLSFPAEMGLWLQRGLAAVTIGIAAWAVFRILDAMILRLGLVQGPNGEETGIRPLLRKFFKGALFLAAAALILRTLGYDIGALMAGLGLGGAALALASKDTLSNFFGSITVFMDRPFKLNDRIKIGAYDGIITEMGVRTSKLQTLENRTVFVPNSIFATTPIENISAAPAIKVAQNFSLKGDNGPDKIGQALDIIREVCSTLPGLENSPELALMSIGGAACQVSLAYFVSRQADYHQTVSAVNLTILRRLAEAGIALG